MFAFLITVLIFSLAVRYGLPLLLRWVVGRVMRQATTGPTGRAPFGGPSPGARPTPEGRVQVTYTPPRTKRQPRPGGYRGGEYVEFEDVKR